ncbi:hypothetical protein SRHO_G00000760 [Serrasalmus rhombeus]
MLEEAGRPPVGVNKPDLYGGSGRGQSSLLMSVDKADVPGAWRVSRFGVFRRSRRSQRSFTCFFLSPFLGIWGSGGLGEGPGQKCLVMKSRAGSVSHLSRSLRAHNGRGQGACQIGELRRLGEMRRTGKDQGAKRDALGVD